MNESSRVANSYKNVEKMPLFGLFHRLMNYTRLCVRRCEVVIGIAQAECEVMSNVYSSS